MPLLFSSMTTPRRRHSRNSHKNRKNKQLHCLVPGYFYPRCNSTPRLVCLCHNNPLIDTHFHRRYIKSPLLLVRSSRLTSASQNLLTTRVSSKRVQCRTPLTSVVVGCLTYPYPHNADRSTGMDPGSWEVKWETRNDCLKALAESCFIIFSAAYVSSLCRPSAMSHISLSRGRTSSMRLYPDEVDLLTVVIRSGTSRWLSRSQAPNIFKAPSQTITIWQAKLGPL